MPTLQKSLIVLFALLVTIACNKSPEAKLTELVPKFQKAMCSKTIECTKDEFAKIPPQYKNMIPAFMQSEDKCIAYFDEKMKDADKKRKEEKQEVSANQVLAFEKCITALEKLSCETFKGAKEKVSIPDCEEAEKYSGNQ